MLLIEGGTSFFRFIQVATSPFIKSRHKCNFIRKGKKFITLQEYEKQYITEVLRQTNGVIYGPKGAAKVLGLKHTTLQSRIKKLGIGRDSRG